MSQSIYKAVKTASVGARAGATGPAGRGLSVRVEHRLQYGALLLSGATVVGRSLCEIELQG